jgi:hypothetical protein
MLFDGDHTAFLYGPTFPDIIMLASQIYPTNFHLNLFILHLQKSPLGSLMLIPDSKISGFICVLVVSKYILMYSFQSEIHLNHTESFVLCSH